MRYIVIGAGAVGGTIGGRLAQSGHDVVLVARGAHLAALQRNGLRLITASGTFAQAIPTVEGPAAIGELGPDDVLILAVKSQDTAGAAREWAAMPVAGGGVAGDRIPIVCAQNGVDNERMVQRLFRTVYGLCVWLPATHLEPGVVITNGAPLSGILIVGRYPHGVDPVVEQIGADLSRSVFDAPVVDDVMRWKYGKLLKNLGNALDALLGDEAAKSPKTTAELWQECEAEGKAALAAAGIAYNTDDERRALQGDRMEIQTIAGAPRAGGSTRQSLVRGTGSVETDYLNGEIALLGRLNGVPTPLNDLLQRLVTDYARNQRAPGGSSPAGLRALLGAAHAQD
ncbi:MULTISPECIES: ketopantoate reductase family protein [unclassified Mycobacterium]|uniref:ketopantoate reductase family protein n=1 Tax=unclassified Mycobacterium TaxID=2642494 RepID=UPI0029C6BCCE|nr:MULTISPECIES: 2-dehydropantoate 2-reductase N-terminal domain-containing protein [unclassified Mycobacterium]